MAVLNSVVSGQMSVTTSQVNLPSHLTISGVLVSNLNASSGSVFVGSQGVTPATGLELVKGNKPVLIPVTDSGALWVVASSTATVSYLVV